MNGSPPPIALTCALVAFASASTALAQETGTPAPPSIDPWRHSEDYRYLADPADRTGAWWEAGKWIPLSDSSALTVGAELRARYEHFKNNEFGDAAIPNEGYELYRLLPYADLHVGEHARAFTQLNLTTANRDDRMIGPVDDTGAEVLQGFIDLSYPSSEAGATARLGRQIMAYGSERLISVRYGPNVLRSFDGGTLSWRTSDSRTDAFFVRPVRNAMGSYNDHADRDRRFWGIYATFLDPRESTGTGLDVYYLGLSADNSRYNQGSGPETRNTVGARLFGKHSGWSWDLEGFYQFGNFAGAPVRAWSVASDVRYTFRDVKLQPRVGMKANIISGDRDPNNPELQTFNVLFPKGKYFGEIGLIGPTNLINLHPSVTLDLGNGWSLGTAMVFYWRESTRDGVYGVSGNLLRASGDSRAAYIGTQGDVVLGWEVSRQLSFEAAYSVFKPGDFIRETGNAETVHFVGLEALWRY
ncbi:MULTISPECIES: alginate export family protein [Stenotrophomonas]|uniref:alginate export family protein n=1 Tax=Stenotrophomonas TaxID=40323 RepID=UPI000B7511D5|nr:MULTISPECIES: alginate export family protein [Stenotrophomonas]SMR83831.1 Alginate export [Stenotrophomonas sp. yr243]SNT66524.1 Alginate export [Stenotrophomonas lactitubi]